jgi:hypothetical protein
MRGVHPMAVVLSGVETADVPAPLRSVRLRGFNDDPVAGTCRLTSGGRALVRFSSMLPTSSPTAWILVTTGAER